VISGRAPGMRAKILFLIGSLDVGGTETQLVALASRLDRRAFDPVVCCIGMPGALASTLRDGGVPVHALGFQPFGWGPFKYLLSLPRAGKMFWGLHRLIKRERPAIVHGMLFFAYVLGTFAGRAGGVPCIVAGRRSLGLFKADRPVFLLLERFASRMTDLFIANSEAVRQDTIAREGIAPERIIVIRNGLDLAKFDGGVPSGLEESLSLTPGPRVIVVSNFIHYKGHTHFLRAWKDVLTRFPSAVALLVGDGVQRRELEQLVDELGIRSGVRFLGVRRDVPALLALSDLYVHPSLQEGFSNALLEAMAAGKPVVATAVGGNIEAIEDGVTGVLVTPADPGALATAMLRLLDDRNRATKIGESARNYVRETCDVEKMVRAYEVTYMRLIQAHSAFGASTVAEAAGRVESSGRSD